MKAYDEMLQKAFKKLEAEEPFEFNDSLVFWYDFLFYSDKEKQSKNLKLHTEKFLGDPITISVEDIKGLMFWINPDDLKKYEAMALLFEYCRS